MRSHGWYARNLETSRESKRRGRELKPRCAVRGCERYWRLYEVEGRGYCFEHAPLYRDHYRILGRIRTFSDREMVI